PIPRSPFSCDLQRRELACVLARGALLPRVGRAFERVTQARVKRLAPFGILDNLLFDVIEAHARDVVHCAVEIARLFAVKLQERAGVLEHFSLSLYLDEELRDLG